MNGSPFIPNPEQQKNLVREWRAQRSERLARIKANRDKTIPMPVVVKSEGK